MKLSGNIAMLDEISQQSHSFAFRSDVSATNVSSKDALLVIIKLNVEGSNGFGTENTNIDDYFFVKEVFKRDATRVFRSRLGPVAEIGHSSEDLKPTNPKATAKVAFVQFVDGSDWGNRAIAQDILRERGLTQAKMLGLLQIYRKGGDQPFRAELLSESPLQTVQDLQRLYEESDGDAKIVVNKIKSMLSAASQHRAGGLMR